MNKHDVQRMVRASFFEAMSDLMEDEPQQAIGWLCKLHHELGWRLGQLLPGKVRDIEQHLNTERLRALLEAGVKPPLQQQVDFTFDLLHMAASADMDKQLKRVRKRLHKVNDDAVLPLFLKHAHEQLDDIGKRIMDLR